MFKIKNILVIDDESTVRALLKEIIMDMNYGFFEAARAEKGLKILEKEEISLVFLDIQLPNTPVYLISAFHNMESVIKNMNLKVEGFIPKPFDIYKINEIVESELEKGDK